MKINERGYGKTSFTLKCFEGGKDYQEKQGVNVSRHKGQEWETNDMQIGGEEYMKRYSTLQKIDKLN